MTLSTGICEPSCPFNERGATMFVLSTCNEQKTCPEESSRHLIKICSGQNYSLGTSEDVENRYMESAGEGMVRCKPSIHSPNYILKVRHSKTDLNFVIPSAQHQRGEIARGSRL